MKIGLVCTAFLASLTSLSMQAEASPASAPADQCLYLGEHPIDELVPAWVAMYNAGDICVDNVYGNHNGVIEPADFSAFVMWINEWWVGPQGDG